MRIFLAALFLAATWGLHPQSPEKNQQNLQTYSDPDAYQVYAALLPSNSAWGGELRAKSLAILQETGPNPQGCFPQDKKEVSETWAAVLEDYKKQNQTPKLLLRNVPIEMPYKLISRTEISDLLTPPRSLEDGAERWKSFYSRHPDSGGYIELSAVACLPRCTKITRHPEF